jgi:hypothetical protein
MSGPIAASPIAAFGPERGLEAPITIESLVGGGVVVGGVVVGGVVVGGVVVGVVVGHPIAIRLRANNSANGISNSFLFTYIFSSFVRIRLP